VCNSTHTLTSSVCCQCVKITQVCCCNITRTCILCEYAETRGTKLSTLVSRVLHLSFLFSVFVPPFVSVCIQRLLTMSHKNASGMFSYSPECKKLGFWRLLLALKQQNKTVVFMNTCIYTCIMWGINLYHRTYNAINGVSYKPMSF
jgi:hypothetical protein